MRFPVGWQTKEFGIEYRVIEGNRCPGDKIMEIKTDGWVRPKIAHTLLLTDFKYEVEENNYGSGENGSPVGKVKRASGWNYLKWALIDVFFQGWRRVAERIDAEVKKAEQRRSADSLKKDWDEMWKREFDHPERL